MALKYPSRESLKPGIKFWPDSLFQFLLFHFWGFKKLLRSANSLKSNKFPFKILHRSTFPPYKLIHMHFHMLLSFYLNKSWHFLNKQTFSFRNYLFVSYLFSFLLKFFLRKFLIIRRKWGFCTIFGINVELGIIFVSRNFLAYGKEKVWEFWWKISWRNSFEIRRFRLKAEIGYSETHPPSLWSFEHASIFRISLLLTNWDKYA